MQKNMKTRARGWQFSGCGVEGGWMDNGYPETTESRRKKRRAPAGKDIAKPVQKAGMLL